jgi:phosphodiesterase/alkaline phosphatase D-like protein
MRRILQVLVLSTVIATSVAGTASAASSPAASTGGATNVGNSTATLNATVNPNGRATQYDFTFGPTTAYGSTSAVHKLKAGTKAVAVAIKLSGLTPGTTYHYRINAINSGGAVLGADRTFTTTGHPPAAWVIQYGLTPAYGMQNFPGTVAAATTPVGVAAELTGLSPATLFHYRIVAYHGSSVVSAGADATFFTEPARRPVPKMTAHTSPGRDRHSPYAFTTSGSLRGAGFIPAAQRCTGNVGVRFFNGRRQLAFVVAAVQPNCTFSVGASFRRLHSRGPARLKVTVDYRGNGYIAPVNRVDHVTAG